MIDDNELTVLLEQVILVIEIKYLYSLQLKKDDVITAGVYNLTHFCTSICSIYISTCNRATRISKTGYIVNNKRKIQICANRKRKKGRVE